MSKPATRCHGVLLVDKPRGITSFDVIRRIKPLVRPTKVGHTGTLDPLATGLLPLVLGEASKLSRFLVAGSKLYRARVSLGAATDTLDAEGRVVERRPVPPLEAGRFAAVAQKFTGDIEQIPPRFSAIRQGGQRLYRLSRQGQAVQPQPRRVRVEELTLLELGPDFFDFQVRCGPGTYIRSLGADLARALGTVGHLSRLVRLETGGWRLEQAVALERLNTRQDVAGHLIDLERVLGRFRRLDPDDEQARRLAQGQTLRSAELERLLGSRPVPAAPLWLRAPHGRWHFLAQVDTDRGRPVMRLLRTLRGPENV